MKQFVIYLAGPMDMVDAETMLGWRKQITELFYNEINDGFIKLLDPTRRPHGSNLTTTEIVDLDLKDIREADIIVADIRQAPRENTGTSCEMFYASYILKKPVIGWIGDVKETKTRIFINYLVSHKFTDLEDITNHIVRYYLK